MLGKQDIAPPAPEEAPRYLDGRIMPFPVLIVLRLPAEHPGQETAEKQGLWFMGSGHKHAAQDCWQSQGMEGHGLPCRDGNAWVCVTRWLSAGSLLQ